MSFGNQYQSIINDCINHLYDQIWQKVAVNNLQRIAPFSVRSETIWTLQSFVFMASSQQKQPSQIAIDHDPIPSPMDSLGIGSNPLEVSKIKEPISSQFQSAHNSTVNWSTKRSSFFQKKFVQQEKKVTGQSSFLTKLPEQQTQNKEFDEDKMRNQYLTSQDIQKNNQKMFLKRQQQNIQRSKKAEKILKDLKKFTFNYEGAYTKIESGYYNNPNVRKIKPNFTNNNVLPKDFPPPQTKTIQNQKVAARQTKSLMNKKQTEKPLFNNIGPKSILQNFQEDLHISEGIKLSQKVGQEQLVKQKKRKTLSGIKKYKLDEFKNFSSGRRFTQHKMMKQNKIVDLSNPGFQSTNLLNDAQKLFQADKAKIKIASSTKKSFVSLQVSEPEQSRSSLPPLYQKSLKNRNLFQRRKQSQLTISETSRFVSKERSVVAIQNQQLYSDNFPLTSTRTNNMFQI